MPRTGLWLRIFVALLLAILPPILLLVGTLLLTESLLRQADPNLVAVLGVIFARVIAEDVRSFVALAERGEPAQSPELGAAYQQLASTLDERNRQVSLLAREARAVPIDDEPRRDRSRRGRSGG